MLVYTNRTSHTSKHTKVTWQTKSQQRIVVSFLCCLHVGNSTGQFWTQFLNEYSIFGLSSQLPILTCYRGMLTLDSLQFTGLSNTCKWHLKVVSFLYCLHIGNSTGWFQRQFLYNYFQAIIAIASTFTCFHDAR